MFIDRFNEDFAPLLGPRGPTFRKLFEKLDEKADKWEFLNIVETGCLRLKDNWAGDRQSTFLFNEFLKTRDGASAWAVDINPDSVREAKTLCDKVLVVEGDGTKFLAGFGLHIDVLYLDSMDLDWANPTPSALNHFFELCAAQRWLGKGSLVMVDDTVFQDGQWLGKGTLVCQYFERTGAKLLASGYQALWEL